MGMDYGDDETKENPLVKALGGKNDDEEAEDIKVSKDEIAACKSFWNAKDDTAKAKALKAFMRLGS